MKKLLAALLLLTSPAHAWDASKFDPGNPAKSGYEIVWSDEFDSLASIDMTQSRAPGFKWYRGFVDGSRPAPPEGWFTIVTEGSRTFLRINSTQDDVEILTSTRTPGMGQSFFNRFDTCPNGACKGVFSGMSQVFNNKAYDGGWFFEYETRFDPTKVNVPYRPNNEACFPVPPAQYVYNPPALTGASSVQNGDVYTIRFNFTSDYPILLNQGIRVTEATPDAYNGWYFVKAAGTGYVEVEKNADPGAYVSGGKINGWGGWYGGTQYDGFANAKGCGCVPGAQTNGCAGWPGVWSISTSWADYNYQKFGAQTGYAEFAENDIIEYAYANWYGTDRFMLLGLNHWYGKWDSDMPQANITGLSWNAGTATITYDTSTLSKNPTVGDTFKLSNVYTHASFYGYIVDKTLTVTEMINGVIVPRSDWKSQIFDSGIAYTPLLTTVIEQVSGTKGGVGVYKLGGSSQTIGSAEAPVPIRHRNILYDGAHVVTEATGSTVKIECCTYDGQTVNPGDFSEGKLAFNPTCPAGGTGLYCLRAGNAFNRLAYAPLGTKWNEWVKVSQLWVPGDYRNGNRGFVETYINGVPVTRSDYITDVSHGGNPLKPHVLNVIDRNHMFLHLEAGAGYPIDINYVRVWKKRQ